MGLLPIQYTKNWEDTYGSQSVPTVEDAIGGAVFISPPIIDMAVVTDDKVDLTLAVNAGITTYTIDFADGNVVVDAGPVVNHQFARNGSYLIQVMDTDRLDSLDMVRINISYFDQDTTGPGAHAPNFTVQPTQSPTPQVDVPCVCDPGSWSADPDATVAYQWFVDGALEGGATTNTFTPLVGNVGQLVNCRVTLSNYLGSEIAFTVAETVLAA